MLRRVNSTFVATLVPPVPLHPRVPRHRTPPGSERRHSHPARRHARRHGSWAPWNDDPKRVIPGTPQPRTSSPGSDPAAPPTPRADQDTVTLGRFLLGIPLVAIAVVPLGLASIGVRRRFLPGWIGVEARLVDVVVIVTGVTLVCEALGTFGLFKTIPVTVGLAFTGLVARGLIRRSSAGGTSSVGPTEAPGTDVEHPADRRGDVALATLGVVSVVGAWFARTAGAITGE